MPYNGCKLGMTIALNELWTGVAALLTILLGVRINRALPLFSAYSIPPAVTGGLLIALLLAVAGGTLGSRRRRAQRPRRPGLRTGTGRRD